MTTEDSVSPRWWPEDLLLDELGLRVRREFVDELETAGLWPNGARVRIVGADQAARGRAFMDSDFPGWLGADDLASLHSESVFGASNHRFGRRLPVVVGFGHELGAGLHGLLGCPPATRPLAAALGATFNFGIVLFDAVCDQVRGGAARIGTVLDAALLRELFVDPGAGARMLSSPVLAESVELRLLFKTVARFFDVLRAHAPAAGFGALARVMDQAFRAEIATTAPASCSVVDVERKSVLPFTITLEALRACCAPGAPGSSPAVDEIVDALGRIVWLVDDLADLGLDLSTGAANAIAMRAAPGDAGNARLVARRLLSSSLTAEVAREIRVLLARVSDPSQGVRMEGGWTFAEWIRTAIRRAVEPTL
jgi:hypothetical protein